MIGLFRAWSEQICSEAYGIIGGFIDDHGPDPSRGGGPGATTIEEKVVWEGTRGHRRLSIELLNYLWRAQGSAASGIRLALDLEPVSLSVDTAVPCGLILNELASNALKHAFRGRGHAEGEVTVSLRRNAQGEVRLGVRDNGTGLPAGFDWSQARTLGLRLVQMLAGQLHAAVEVSSVGGTEFKISFERAKE